MRILHLGRRCHSLVASRCIRHQKIKGLACCWVLIWIEAKVPIMLAARQDGGPRTSSASPRFRTSNPAASASFAAAAIDWEGAATMRVSASFRRGSSGDTMGDPSVIARRIWGGRAIPRVPRMLSTAFVVLSSPTVGPDAIRHGSSPGTSYINSVSNWAGWQAAANCPPFT